ncbi:MAG: hypothetical protein AB4352_12020 [Hormoscilla sp.]
MANGEWQIAHFSILNSPFSILHSQFLRSQTPEALELIGRAVAEFIQSHKIVPQSDRVAALERFLALAEETSKKHRLPEGDRFNRDELYGEYNARLPE